MTECPVCGTEIGETNAQPDAGYGGEEYPPAQAEHEGQAYQFCCSEHKEEFQASPGRYA